MKTLLRFGVLGAVAISACAKDPVDETPPDITPAATDPDLELAAVIGPAGGTITGPPETAFVGLQLVVPPGALDADTRIAISPAADSTRLPPLAERVGQGFAVTSAAALRKPLTLTLPVDSGALSLFEKPASDVKVWVRNGEGWQLVPAVSSSTTAVTIDLAQPTTAAAGVTINLIGLSCLSTNTCVPATGCQDADGFCVTDLGVAPQPTDRLGAVSNNNFFYLSSGPEGRFAVRFDLAAKTFVKSQPLADGSGMTNATIDTDGSLWTGRNFGHGNVQWRFGNPSQIFDGGRPADGSLGMVRLTNGQSVRLTTHGFAVGSDFNAFLFSARLMQGTPLFADPNRDNEVIAVERTTVSNGARLRRYSSNGNALGIATFPGPYVTQSNTAASSFRVSSTELTVSIGTFCTTLTGCATPNSRIQKCTFRGFEEFCITLLDNTSTPSLAHDGAGLWIAGLTTPAIMFLAESGGLSVRDLTQEVPGVPAADLLPRVVRTVSPKKVVVQTTGGRLLLIERKS